MTRPPCPFVGPNHTKVAEPPPPDPDPRQLRIGSLFSGIGGLDLAVEALTGGRVVWQCEMNPAAALVLAQHWPDVPNLGDITAVDWKGPISGGDANGSLADVDIICGGFP